MRGAVQDDELPCGRVDQLGVERLQVLGPQPVVEVPSVKRRHPDVPRVPELLSLERLEVLPEVRHRDAKAARQRRRQGQFHVSLRHAGSRHFDLSATGIARSQSAVRPPRRQGSRRRRVVERARPLRVFEGLSGRPGRLDPVEGVEQDEAADPVETVYRAAQ